MSGRVGPRTKGVVLRPRGPRDAPFHEATPASVHPSVKAALTEVIRADADGVVRATGVTGPSSGGPAPAFHLPTPSPPWAAVRGAKAPPTGLVRAPRVGLPSAGRAPHSRAAVRAPEFVSPSGHSSSRRVAGRRNRLTRTAMSGARRDARRNIASFSLSYAPNRRSSSYSWPTSHGSRSPWKVKPIRNKQGPTKTWAARGCRSWSR